MPYKIAYRVHFDTGELVTKTGLTPEGHEIADPTPMAPPIGYRKQPSMMENIRNMVRSEALRQAAEAAGADTFEEAEDFNVGDDFDPQSPYEEVFDPQIGVGTYDPAFPSAVAAVTAKKAKTAAPPSDGPTQPTSEPSKTVAPSTAPKTAPEA